MINRNISLRAMLGYALWIVIEDTLRNWLTRRLIEIYGSKWTEQFPPGIWNKLLQKHNQQVKPKDTDRIRDLLEYSDFPDLFDIVKYRKQFKQFLSQGTIEDIDYYSEKLYTLRNQIAHKPYSFNSRNLDDLVDCSTWILSFVGSLGTVLNEVKVGIETQPEKYAIEIPQSFINNTVLEKRLPSFSIIYRLWIMSMMAVLLAGVMKSEKLKKGFWIRESIP